MCVSMCMYVCLSDDLEGQSKHPWVIYSHLGDHLTTECRLSRMSVFASCIAGYFDMAFPESSAVFSFRILRQIPPHRVPSTLCYTQDSRMQAKLRDVPRPHVSPIRLQRTESGLTPFRSNRLLCLCSACLSGRWTRALNLIT